LAGGKEKVELRENLFVLLEEEDASSMHKKERIASGQGKRMREFPSGKGKKKAVSGLYEREDRNAVPF